MGGPGIEKKGCITGAQATDILPTVLTLLGVSIPSDMDGKPIMDALTLEQQKCIKWIAPNEVVSKEIVNPDLNPEEVDEIEARLRDLGYLG